MMFDCHMHSFFSADSKMDPLEACNAAVKLGLNGITFTDHLDYDYPDENIFIVDLDTFFPFMEDLKAKFIGKLKVLKGIEVGIQPQVIEKTAGKVAEFDFDYVIGSMHVIGRLDPGNPSHDFFSGKTQKLSYGSYLEEILYMVKNFHEFDALGHIDYVRRYGSYVVKSLCYYDYKDLIDSILIELISKGKGLEVNSGGYRCKLSPPLVDLEILKRYKALGGEIICTGSDAHSIENIADHFDAVKELISNAGYKYIAHFEKRKPIFEKI